MTFRTGGSEKAEQIGLRIHLCGCFLWFVEKLVGKCSKFQFGENRTQCLLVWFHHLQIIHVQFDGNIGANRGEELRHLDIIHRCFNLLTKLTFHLIGVAQQVFNCSKLVDQFYGSFLSYARTAWEVVG